MPWQGPSSSRDCGWCWWLGTSLARYALLQPHMSSSVTSCHTTLLLQRGTCLTCSSSLALPVDPPFLLNCQNWLCQCIAKVSPSILLSFIYYNKAWACSFVCTTDCKYQELMIWSLLFTPFWFPKGLGDMDGWSEEGKCWCCTGKPYPEPLPPPHGIWAAEKNLSQWAKQHTDVAAIPSLHWGPGKRHLGIHEEKGMKKHWDSRWDCCGAQWKGRCRNE